MLVSQPSSTASFIDLVESRVMAGKITAPSLIKMREAGEKIVCLTAYDAILGRMADESGADVVLVGDSVGNTLLGFDTTIPVSLSDIIHHLKAVRKGVKRALLVADLPFGSYQVSAQQAVESSIELMKAGAEAVKLEGPYYDQVKAIFKAGIPVMGHVGMTPQSFHAFGGFKVQGRGDQAERIISESIQLEKDGVFGIVLELIPSALSQKISETIGIPTIGIGAGPHCSGQIQVIYDVLGFGEKTLKHARAFVDSHNSIKTGLSEYVSSVRHGTFPSEENSF